MNKPVVLDGAMGTMLQRSGKLPVGENPSKLNIESPETVAAVHRAYLQAGSDIIITNTFAATALPNFEEIISCGVKVAREAIEGFSAKVALNIGPLQNSLEPVGSCGEETAYEMFRKQVLAGVAAGADIVYIETMTDLNEAKIAVSAAKESCGLPVFCTMTFEENLRTFMGVSLSEMAETLESVGVDAVGINCSVGPAIMFEMARELKRHTKLPLIIKPNAGLPTIENGEIVYNVSPAEFAAEMRGIIELGVDFVGGCCGTNPEFIAALKQAV